MKDAQAPAVNAVLSEEGEHLVDLRNGLASRVRFCVLAASYEWNGVHGFYRATVFGDGNGLGPWHNVISEDTCKRLRASGVPSYLGGCAT